MQEKRLCIAVSQAMSKKKTPTLVGQKRLKGKGKTREGKGNPTLLLGGEKNGKFKHRKVNAHPKQESSGEEETVWAQKNGQTPHSGKAMA